MCNLLFEEVLTTDVILDVDHCNSMDSGSNSNGGQNNEHFEKSASNSAAKHVKFQNRSRRQLSLEIPGKLHVWFLGYKTRAGKIS